MRSIIFIFFVLTSSLFSSTLVDLYRSAGIEAVERELIKELESQKYWRGYFEDRDIRFGYYESSEYIIVAEKSPLKLSYYKRDGKKVEHISSVDSFVGEVRGAKRKEGDLKTPIGAYNLTRKLVDLDQFYGPMAFVISYPNLLDKIKRRDGYGIWIHGLPLSGDRPTVTQGCIAISNDNIIELDKNIDHKKSVVVIWEGEQKDVKSEDLEIIMSSIYQWRRAWEKNKLEEYLSFYAEDFTRFDGKKIDEFRAMKRSVFRIASDKSILFKDFDITPYPNEEGDNLYRVTFFEDYRASNYEFQGEKELYVRVEDGSMKIVVER